MRLTEYITQLQLIKDEYGDLELIYAKDDEGNGYQEVRYLPTRVYYNKSDRELISESDIEDYDLPEYKIVCCVN